MDATFSVRFSRDESREIEELASAAGVSKAEIIRRQWRARGGVPIAELAETLAQVAAVVMHVDERLGGIEERQAQAAEAGDIAALLAALAQRQGDTEAALNNLARAVERLYSAPGVSGVRPTQSAPAAAAAGAQNAAPGDQRKPAPAGGFATWIRDQAFVSDDEQPHQRAARLKPTYNQTFFPPAP